MFTNFTSMALMIFRSITISAIVLLLINQVAMAQEKLPYEDIALQKTSKINGISHKDVRLLNSAESNLSNINKKLFSFKFLDEKHGRIVGITLDSFGNELRADELKELKEQDRVVYQVLHGKIDPTLSAKIADNLKLPVAKQAEKLKVIIWLHEPDNDPSAMFNEISKFKNKSEVKINALLQRNANKQSQLVNAVVAPVSDKIRLFDPNLKTNALAPVIYATLSPDDIREIDAWPEVDTIYEDSVSYPAMNIARQVVRANLVNSAGTTGTGIKVAQIEVGGRVALANPFLKGVVQNTQHLCTTLAGHGTGIAGIIKSTHSSVRGIAPNVQLWSGGSCPTGKTGSVVNSELESQATLAINWGASALNLSYGGDKALIPVAHDKFFDRVVFTNHRSVIAAAGNRGIQKLANGTIVPGDGNVTTPGLAYNVITVGASDDKNTVPLVGDVMANYSSYKNPITSHSDNRLKPEVVAPGTNIMSTTLASPWIGPIGSGTSYAAPIVTGLAALLIQRNPNLNLFPAAVKAIVLATATHRIIYPAALARPKPSEDEIDAKFAYDVAGARRSIGFFGWNAVSHSCLSATTSNLATMSLTAGKPVRAAIVWYQNPNYTNYANEPSADLDLKVLDPSGSTVVTSESFDNSYEMVRFTPAKTGNYKLQMNRFRCDLTPGLLAWAWH